MKSKTPLKAIDACLSTPGNVEYCAVVKNTERIKYACVWGAYDYWDIKVMLKHEERERVNEHLSKHDWKWHDGTPIRMESGLCTVNLPGHTACPRIGERVTIRMCYNPHPHESSIERQGTMDDDAIRCSIV